MADNVPITAGSGTNIATDDVSGVHYQRMKLVDGTLDSTTAIPGDGSGLFVQGQAAHDAGVAGNPFALAGKALNSPAAVTDVNADGDATRLLCTRGGLLYVETSHPNRWQAIGAGYSSAQTNTSLKAAPGASLYLYITDVVISNGATAGYAKLIDGSGGSTLLEFYLAINGGATVNLKTPIRLTANTALCFTSTTVTTHGITVCGFTAP